MNNLIVTTKNREEYDKALLQFLLIIYNLKKKAPSLEIHRINLTKCADKAGLKSIPTQDILAKKVDWSVEPTIETACLVHEEFIAYNREMKKRNDERMRDVYAGMDKEPATPSNALTEDMVRKMIADAMGSTACDNSSISELTRKLAAAQNRIAYLEGELDKIVIKRDEYKEKMEQNGRELAKLIEANNELDTIIDRKDLYIDEMHKLINTFATSTIDLRNSFVDTDGKDKNNKA